MSSINPKVSIENVLAAARDAGVPAEQVKLIQRDLLKAAEEEKADRAPVEKSRMQFVAIIDDPEGKYENQGFVGWVLQIEDDLAPMVAVDRVKAAAKAFNESRKGKRKPVKNIREVFAGVPRRFWKEEGKKTLPKCKEPIAMIPVRGELT